MLISFGACILKKFEQTTERYNCRERIFDMKFIADPEVFKALDGVCFGIVAAEGIDNTAAHPEIARMLEQNIAFCEADFEGREVKTGPETAPYREAFTKNGMNPNKFMCSIEALLTRIAKKKGFPSINPAVDLGNAVSLKYKLPIGAHDICSAHDRTIEVRRSRAGDSFVPFGATESEQVPENELVYASGDTVRTRRWIWRQSEHGKITSEVTDIFFPIDGFEHINKDKMLAARDELAALLAENFGCKVTVGWVDAANPEFDSEKVR